MKWSAGVTQGANRRTSTLSRQTRRPEKEGRSGAVALLANLMVPQSSLSLNVLRVLALAIPMLTGAVFVI